MNDIRSFYTLHSENSSLVVDCRGNAAAILYWGSRLAAATTPEMLAHLVARPAAPAKPEIEPPIALSPEAGAGFPGSAGIQVHRDGKQWGVYSKIEAVNEVDEERLTIVSACDATEIRIVHELGLDRDSNVLTAITEITNSGSSELSVAFCGAPSIPIPAYYDKILGFEGRWSNEFQLRTIDRFVGTYARENRAGRTSHDTFPGVILHASQTNERGGAAYGLHLGWSGNHSVRVEGLSDGRAYAQLGELLFPGELSLAPGDSYRSPKLYGTHTDQGLTGVSRNFHRFVRTHLTAGRVRGKPKPVHFNSWEAMYFDLSLERLCALADAAADVGAERFVLDDGWFRNRRSDKAGLGDWYVDETVFPDGLQALIQHVNAQGMDFGLWVEPEMVNPDSDLYRSHPDWVLSATPAPLLLSRHQLVLDLTRPEVQDYLFERLDALLSDHSISYLKWDMNRDVSQPGGRDGRVVSHCQTLAFYDMLKRVRDAHPTVEIESCSSGGARADFGVLEHVDRIWPSDNNDPLDRLRIHKGFSLFFPAEFMGAHVGPRDCHVSGRHISLATRAGVAMFGNMGIEANLLEFRDDERSELKAAVALHKKHRDLLFSGDLFRLDMKDCENAFGIVSADKREALFSYAVLDSLPHSAPGCLRFRGLQHDQIYDVKIVWPLGPGSVSASLLASIHSKAASGAALMEVGLQLPILQPAQVIIFHLAQVS
ncbi:MAG: alpha-galactosidase [Gammaproteobacteria bacterium]|nr:alpha-galactosidase [Gammaproteobacteria bacterium]